MANNNFWKGVFSDVDGSFSFKRIQTGVFTVLFVLITIGNLYWKLVVSDNILNVLTALLIYGYTGITVEKFTNRGKDITP